MGERGYVDRSGVRLGEGEEVGKNTLADIRKLAFESWREVLKIIHAREASNLNYLDWRGEKKGNMAQTGDINRGKSEWGDSRVKEKRWLIPIKKPNN